MTDAGITRRDLAGVVGAGVAGVTSTALPGYDQAPAETYPNAQFRQDRIGAVVRPLRDKLAETVSIMDFGAESGKDVVAAMTRALESFGRDRPGLLLIPPGEWVVSQAVDWSRFKHITLQIQPGAVFRHGGNPMTLPARVETGTTPHIAFDGTGAVTMYDKDTVAYDRLPAGWKPHPNSAIGLCALSASTTGTNNLAWGIDALRNSAGASGNIAIGNETLSRVIGGKVPAPGTQTGYGWNNIALGETALRDCSEGYENLAIGAFSLQQTTSGRWNIAVGHASQIIANTAEGNVSLGAYTLVTNSGSNNLAIGWAALEGQATGSNIALGHMAMNANSTGNLNTAVGIEAMMRLRSGNRNVSIGVGSLTNLTIGNGNTGVGSYALSQASGAATDNTAVGRDALITLSTGNGNTALGAGALSTLRAYANCTGVGAGTAVSGSNQVQLGNAQAVPHAFGALQIRSDARDKADVRDTLLGLDFINALRPVDFRWNLREDYRAAGLTGSSGLERTRFHHGLLAQDVRAVLQRSGVDFGGFQDHRVNGGEDVLSLGYEELIAPLIKAVQELSIRVDELHRQLAYSSSPQRASGRT